MKEMSIMKQAVLIALLVLFSVSAIELKQRKWFSKFLAIEKTLFVYNSTAYGNWSDWGKCSRTEGCIQTRYRSCLDSSYLLANDDYKKNANCNTKFIIERRICEGDKLEECKNEIEEKREKMKSVLRNCGTKKDINRKVVGGTDAESNNAWPWNVGLSVSKEGVFESTHPQCGGTLITPRHVITAAHCVETILTFVNVNSRRTIRDKWVGISSLDKKVKFSVRVNDYDLRAEDPDEMSMEVEAFRYHPKYSPVSVNNDFAILRLKKPFPTEKVQTACLPRAKKTLPLNSTCYATGWGYYQQKEVTEEPELPRIYENLFDNLLSLLQQDRELDLDYYPIRLNKAREDEIDTRQQSNTLLQAKIPLKSLSECRKVFRRLSSESHICAGEPGVDTCQGDSGGGLYCQDKKLEDKWVLYGVTSYGSDAGCGIYSSIYASVASYRDWVEEILLSEKLEEEPIEEIEEDQLEE